MIPQYQLSPRDCMRACLVSIFEVGLYGIQSLDTYLREIGNSTELSDLEDSIWESWLAQEADRYGYSIQVLPNSRKVPVFPELLVGYSIAIGFEAHLQEHACVYLNGKLVHDPWKDGEGLVKVTKYVIFRKHED